MNKILKAIEEIKKYYPKFNEIEITEIKESENYCLINKTLYAKEISKTLFFLANHLQNHKVEITDHFKAYGTMIDLSRNAVFTVDYFKEVIRKQALLGINTILLYTEDTYEVKDLPYFGYMRGKYTELEIIELVSYAEIFGIELIPCIQTLGHMGQFLRWGHNNYLKDQLTVLMPNTDKTIDAIEKMIVACRKMYKTNKIHIGLDEAFGFGLGNYYKKHGYQKQYDIFVKHLHRVNELCLKYGFDKVQIWSDMFFRMANTNEEYYDTTSVIPESIINDIPTNVELVYWDYYNYNKEMYEKMIKRHQSFKREVIMASGTWIWTKIVYDKNQTDKTALHAIHTSIENNVKQFYFTQWMDDGAPCDYETVYLGLFELAYVALTKNELKKEVFDFIMNEKYEDQLYLTKLNHSVIEPVGILWDDILNGIYLNNENACNKENVFNALKVFKEFIQKNKLDQSIFTNQHALLCAKVFKIKIESRLELLNAYFTTNDFTKTLLLANKAIKMLTELNNSFREMWLSRYKAFGLDVIQTRIASLIERYNELKRRINDYQSGKLKKIDELEEKAEIGQYIRFCHQNIFYSSVHILGY